MKQRIVSGDNVIILSGKYKGKIGKVIKVLLLKVSKIQRVFITVTGVNLCKKSVKLDNNNQSGFRYLERPIDRSNAALFDSSLGVATKVRYDFVDGKKVRVMKSSSKVVG